MSSDAIIAVYATTSQAALYKKMDDLGISQEKIEETAKDIGRKRNRDKPKQYKFTITFPVESEDELLYGNETVFDAGIYRDPARWIKTNDQGINFYFRTKTAVMQKERRRPRKKIKPLMEYCSKNDKFGKVLMSKYILPLTSPLSFRNKEKLEKELREFGRIHRTEPQMKKIVEAIKNNRGKLVSLYVDQVIAVHEENYEQAAKLQDKIEILEAKR